jgi:hypothetical protein
MVPTFNGLQVIGFAPKHVWRLEMKWDVVKHDVAKFFSFLSTVDRVKEFDTMFENLVEKALLLYQDKISLNFTYLHYWKFFGRCYHGRG